MSIKSNSTLVTLDLLRHLSDRTGVFVTSGLVARDVSEQ